VYGQQISEVFFTLQGYDDEESEDDEDDKVTFLLPCSLLATPPRPLVFPPTLCSPLSFTYSRSTHLVLSVDPEQVKAASMCVSM